MFTETNTEPGTRQTDTIGRALFSPYTQTPNRKFQPDDNHRRAMAFIHRHTMASSDTLYELMRDTPGLRHRHNFNEWLKGLYDGMMVFKPEKQQDTKNPDSHFHVYALSAKGEKALELEPVIRHSGPFRHQLMGATITAMKDVMCQRNGHRYLTGPEVLARITTTELPPVLAKKVSIPFWWNGRLIKDERYTSFDPDMIDGIQYGDGRIVIYIDEYNCHTETLRPTKDFKRRSVLKTILQMQTFLGEQAYKKAYRLSATAMFSYYTTNSIHADNIVELIGATVGSCPYITVGVETSFRTPFKPPRMPVHLFEGELKRAFKRPWIIGSLPE